MGFKTTTKVPIHLVFDAYALSCVIFWGFIEIIGSESNLSFVRKAKKPIATIFVSTCVLYEEIFNDVTYSNEWRQHKIVVANDTLFALKLEIGFHSIKFRLYFVILTLHIKTLDMIYYVKCINERHDSWLRYSHGLQNSPDLNPVEHIWD